jgi:TusA-related sulfurtransferase
VGLSFGTEVPQVLIAERENSLLQEVWTVADSGSTNQAHQILDCIGLYCPAPILKTRQQIDKLAIGEILEVWADDPAAEEDLKAWAKRSRQKILKIEKTDEGTKFLILKEK